MGQSHSAAGCLLMYEVMERPGNITLLINEFWRSKLHETEQSRIHWSLRTSEEGCLIFNFDMTIANVLWHREKLKLDSFTAYCQLLHMWLHQFFYILYVPLQKMQKMHQTWPLFVTGNFSVCLVFSSKHTLQLFVPSWHQFLSTLVSIFTFWVLNIAAGRLAGMEDIFIWPCDAVF